MSRAQLERHGYLKSFPNLLGARLLPVRRRAPHPRRVGRFGRGRRAAGPTRWSPPISCWRRPPATRSIRSPPRAARCRPTGSLFDVAADCFRREPSTDIDRFQSFRMREYVRIGTQAQIQAFREDWIERATGIADGSGFSYRIDLASDPFFGRGGQIVAASQIAAGAEIRAAGAGASRPRSRPPA